MAWQYDDKAVLKRDPKTGFPLPRLPGTPTPCKSCPKPPTWAKAMGKEHRELRALADELTPQNRDAIAFYFQCKATARFPDDPLVSWYAGIIREAEDEYAQVVGEKTYLVTRAFLESLVSFARRLA